MPETLKHCIVNLFFSINFRPLFHNHSMLDPSWHFCGWTNWFYLFFCLLMSIKKKSGTLLTVANSEMVDMVIAKFGRHEKINYVNWRKFWTQHDQCALFNCLRRRGMRTFLFSRKIMSFIHPDAWLKGFWQLFVYNVHLH